MDRLSAAGLDALIEEATVDCHDEDEQFLGLYTMMVDQLALPFPTVVLGVEVTVEDLDVSGRWNIVARCSRGMQSLYWIFRCRPRRRPERSGSRRTVAGQRDPPATAAA